MNQGLKTGNPAAYGSYTPGRLLHRTAGPADRAFLAHGRLEYMRDMRRRNLYFALAMVVSGEYTPRAGKFGMLFISQ
jgi:hypothetical protein